MSLGQVQTEEGYSSDAVETYLQVLALQEDEDPDEVADAHVQARGVRSSTLYTGYSESFFVEQQGHAGGSMACGFSPLRTAVTMPLLRCCLLAGGDQHARQPQPH